MYRIVNWDEHFENNRSRDLKSLDWVPIPNKLDGDGYTELLDHEHGTSHYGVWIGIIQVASKCRPRGTLVRDGAVPHDARSLARMTRMNVETIDCAIDRLVYQIGWLEIIPDPEPTKALIQSRTQVPESRTQLRKSAYGREGKGIEGKRTEEKGTEDTSAASAADSDVPVSEKEIDADLSTWLQWWNSLRLEQLVASGVDEREPSKGVLSGWKRVKKTPALREMLADRDAIEREIRASAFCRESWFRLEKLFGSLNRDNEFIIKKLLDGGYRNKASPPPPPKPPRPGDQLRQRMANK